MQRSLKWSIVLIILAVAFPLISVLFHRKDIDVTLQASRKIKDELNRPCGLVIFDLKSNDITTAVAAQGIVFGTMKDELHLSKIVPDSPATAQTWQAQVRELITQCQQHPNQSMKQLLIQFYPETRFAHEQVE
jgi:hypothetical protein